MPIIKRIPTLLALFFLLNTAHSKDTRVVNLVVPFTAGSAQDIFVRFISEPLGRELKSQVNVLNKPGAGGTIAAAYVAQTKPDGLTYLVGSSSHHFTGALYPRLPYDPLRSFQGAVLFAYSDFVLIASSALNTPNLSAFVAQTNNNPNAFNYASAGNGSSTHVGMASFLRRAGLDMLHVPLKGTNEIINEVLSGRVQAAMVAALSIEAYKNDPRIKLLGITGRHRSSVFPDLPTLIESGFPSFQWYAWSGLLAPAGAPLINTQEMHRAFMKISEEPKIKTRYQQLGVVYRPMSMAQFDFLLREDWLKSSALISELNIKLD
jgi:tripartite-type tricarboxylate transporter receptor subunit TctC